MAYIGHRTAPASTAAAAMSFFLIFYFTYDYPYYKRKDNHSDYNSRYHFSHLRYIPSDFDFIFSILLSLCGLRSRYIKVLTASKETKVPIPKVPAVNRLPS